VSENNQDMIIEDPEQLGLRHETTLQADVLCAAVSNGRPAHSTSLRASSDTAWVRRFAFLFALSELRWRRQGDRLWI
jgi:hypothetical protein